IGRDKYERSTFVPRLIGMFHQHSDVRGWKRYSVDRFIRTAMHKTDKRIAARSKHAAQFRQPLIPTMAQMAENGDCKYKIEGIRFQRKIRIFAVLKNVKRRAEIFIQPHNAAHINVATPYLCLRGFRRKMAQDSSNTAAKVQKPLTFKLPISG